MRTLENLLLDELAEMYDAEQQMARALSSMAKLAANDRLREALKQHSFETVGHISKLARIFECFGEAPVMVKCPFFIGLLVEGRARVAQYQYDESPARDAAIVAAMLKLENYEMATYVCLRDWAKVMNNHAAAMFLDEILEEEKSSHHQLDELGHALQLEALGGREANSASEGEEEETLAHPGCSRVNHRDGLP